MARRRYQEGTFLVENGHYYSFFSRDRAMPDGTIRSVKERFDHGKVGEISERFARSEHGRLRVKINRERGSVPKAPKGETFKDAADSYVSDILPNLTCSTVRQRKSHLRKHLTPHFGDSALIHLNVPSIQKFVTELQKKSLTRKTIINILGTFLAVLDYAGKSGIRVTDAKLEDLKIQSDKGAEEAPYFKASDAAQIIKAAKEPYKTMFALAWATGLRAGELLGLRVTDLDFHGKLIRPSKQADDSTRSLRDLKTKGSKTPIAMTAELESILCTYLNTIWKKNEAGLLFPNRTGRPRKRQYVVKFGLKPVLRKLGLPVEGVGLHAFRHGLGTALSEKQVSPKTVQGILRHSDIKTTFRYYVHSEKDAERKALDLVSIGTSVPIGTEIPA